MKLIKPWYSMTDMEKTEALGVMKKEYFARGGKITKLSE